MLLFLGGGKVAYLIPLLGTFRLTQNSFCALHISRRNEELHSGGTPFDGIPIDSWQPLYYEACDTLMKCMGGTLSDFIGAAETQTASAMITAAKDESAQAIAKSVAAHKTVWESKSDKERKRLSGHASLWATKQAGHRVKCPACECDALVFGGPTAPPTVKLEDDTIIETQEFLPSKFECVACVA